MKKRTIIIVILIIIIFAISFGVFNFAKSPTSEQTRSWFDFGSFIGEVFGLLLSLISVFFIQHTIKLTQKNHNEQVELIRKNQTYTQFTDLCVCLDKALSESWLNEKKPYFKEKLRKIKNTTLSQVSIKKTNDIPSKFAICIESAASILDKETKSIEEIAIIFHSLSEFFLIGKDDTKNIMFNVLGLKISKEQRFIFYMILSRRDIYRIEKNMLDEYPPNFWVECWVMDFLSDGE